MYDRPSVPHMSFHEEMSCFMSHFRYRIGLMLNGFYKVGLDLTSEMLPGHGSYASQNSRHAHRYNINCYDVIIRLYYPSIEKRGKKSFCLMASGSTTNS